MKNSPVKVTTFSQQSTFAFKFDTCDTCAEQLSFVILITPHLLHDLITGSDEDAIMAVLGARSNKQRQEIAAKFEQEYGKVSSFTSCICLPNGRPLFCRRASFR